MKRWQCPWYKSKWITIPYHYHEERLCNLFPKKTKCLFQDAPTIDINSCRRVKQIIDALGKKYKSKQEQDIILQAFITAVNVYFDQFIEEVGRNPRYFRYMVGKWLQEKCRKDIACPFKPLLPETL